MRLLFVYGVKPGVSLKKYRIYANIVNSKSTRRINYNNVLNILCKLQNMYISKQWDENINIDMTNAMRCRYINSRILMCRKIINIVISYI